MSPKARTRKRAPRAGELLCGWCGEPRLCPWEHSRPDRHAAFARRWVPTCDQCHRWLTGLVGTLPANLVDGPDRYRHVPTTRPATRPSSPPPPTPSSSTDTQPEPPAPFDRAVAGSEASAGKWTPDEARLVTLAIARIARRGEEFTADDVWHELNGAVPVTKGLTARLVAAQRAGLIANTERTTKANRGGHHDHAQRLTIWQGLG